LKLSEVVFRELVFLSYSSSYFNVGGERIKRTVKDLKSRALLVKVSFAGAIAILSVTGGIIGLFMRDQPEGFLVLSSLIILYAVGNGVGIVYSLTISNLPQALLSFPLTQKDVNGALVAGVLKFLDAGLVISVLVPPLSSYAFSHSLVQSYQVLMQMISTTSFALLMMFYAGRRVRSGASITAVRLGTGVFFMVSLLSLLSPEMGVRLTRPKPISHYLLPLYPFAFTGSIALILSTLYSTALASGLAWELNHFSVSTHPHTEPSPRHSIRLRNPIYVMVRKDLKALVTIPQFGAILTAPVIAGALSFALKDPVIAVFYSLYVIALASSYSVMAEMKGLPLLLSIPGGIRYSVTSKLLITVFLYALSFSVTIFQGVSGILVGLLLLPAAVSSFSLSTILSLRDVMRGKGIGLVSPIEVLLRSIQVMSIPSIAFLLFFLSVYGSVAFSLASMVVLLVFAFKTSEIRGL
jgi:hypothetical protein